MKKRVILAYSGGLDTSVAIKWLQEKYDSEVITLTVDIGQGEEIEPIVEKARNVGAIKAIALDLRREFLTDYAFKALRANCTYEYNYHLSAALSRPLIASYLVKLAKEHNASAVSHGCTAKGNDQVRFDLTIKTLKEDLAIWAPMREWVMTREEEIDYAQKNNIPVPVGKKSPFSIDLNLWGRSIEAGPIEDIEKEPPEEAFHLVVSPEKAPDKPEYVEIEFENNVPVRLNSNEMKPEELVEKLNKIAGSHGVGRSDMVENRLVGIKTREVYEAPAATVLVKAHKDLESLVLPRDLYHFKSLIDEKYSCLIYDGLWFSPLKNALDSFIDSFSERITGKVKIKLYKGNATVVGRSSPYSMYQKDLATYGQNDSFIHNSAVGFIDIFSLPNRVYYRAGHNEKRF